MFQYGKLRNLVRVKIIVTEIVDLE